MNGRSDVALMQAGSRLSAVLDDFQSPDELDALLRALLDADCDKLPYPGAGDTLARWQALATVAACDLVAGKLFESHTDALAIWHELDPAGQPDISGLWGVWCAEPPQQRVLLSGTRHGSNSVRIHGTKPWCSGAAYVSHALVSAWDELERPQLVSVSMKQTGVSVTRSGWHALGMSRTDSVDVLFEGAEARLLGAPGSYVRRAGFQHGGAGVAACWFGGAHAVAQHVLQAARKRPLDQHLLAHLGAIDIAIAQSRALLREAAADIDAHPQNACETSIRRARLAAEACAETLLLRAPRAMGAGPLCKDKRLAQMLADLPVFIRQSHAERDLAQHGLSLSQEKCFNSWTL
jgi:hypothetical protein